MPKFVAYEIIKKTNEFIKYPVLYPFFRRRDLIKMACYTNRDFPVAQEEQSLVRKYALKAGNERLFYKYFTTYTAKTVYHVSFSRNREFISQVKKAYATYSVGNKKTIYKVYIEGLVRSRDPYVMKHTGRMTYWSPRAISYIFSQNNKALIDIYLDQPKIKWDAVLEGATYAGNDFYIQLALANGASNWITQARQAGYTGNLTAGFSAGGLGVKNIEDVHGFSFSKKGNIEAVKWMMERNLGDCFLEAACQSNNLEIILYLKQFYTFDDYCEKQLIRTGNNIILEIIKGKK